MFFGHAHPWGVSLPTVFAQETSWDRYMDAAGAAYEQGNYRSRGDLKRSKGVALMFQPVAARSHNYCLERVGIMRPDGEHELEKHFVCSLAFGVSHVAELTANLVELTRPESEN